MKSYSKKKPRGTSSAKKKKPSPKVELDLAFGNYIKRKNLTSDGRVFCFTSFYSYSLAEIEVGHFIQRSCLRLRWDARNVFPQSIGDNRFKNGNLEIYASHLNMIYGEGFTRGLEEESREILRFHPNEIKELTKQYKALTKELSIDPNIGKITDNGKIMWKDWENYYICLDKDKLKRI